MEIKLGGKNKGVTLVSTEDYEIVSKYKWYLDKNGYVIGKVNKKSYKLHRFIMKPNKNEQVDHIHGNKLDNRRENLRNSTSAKNGENKGKRNNAKSQYFGVSLSRKKYRSSIKHDGVIHQLGFYNTEIEAAEKRDIYIVHNNLDHFRLNFPDKKDDYKNMAYEYNTISKQNKQKTSKYLGVYKQNSYFCAMISIKSKNYYIGKSENEEKCASMYDEYIIKNNIPRKKLNFPEKYNHDNNIIKTSYKTIDVNVIQLIIPLLLDKYITINKEDYALVKYHNCYINPSGYIQVSINGKNQLLHRIIMGVTNKHLFIDHIDGNPLNNTRDNLRFSDSKKNAQNKKKQSIESSSKYVGIYLENRTKKWGGVIRKDYEVIYNHLDLTEEFAVRRRDIYILENLQDTHFKLNFNWTPEEVNEWKIKLDYKKKKTSQYIGVSYNTNRNIYVSATELNKKIIFSKSHKDETTLARMRDLFILENYKNTKLKLNFEWTSKEINEWKGKLNIKQ